LIRTIDVTTEPMWVDGDPVRLEQVLTNVVTNAVKYTPAGGRIRVGLRADGDDAVLAVEDDGFGVSPELMPHIFGVVHAERANARSRSRRNGNRPDAGRSPTRRVLLIEDNGDVREMPRTILELAGHESTMRMGSAASNC